MVIKNWKKDFDKKDTFQYRNKKNNDILTAIKMTGKEPTSTWKGWIVDVNFGKKSRRAFKTKAQALKYAKAYMRKN